VTAQATETPAPAPAKPPTAQDAIKIARKRPDLSAPVIIPIIVIAAGAYLAWFAVKYWRGSGQAVWPSYPIKQILQGKGLPADTQAASATVTLDSWESSQGTSGGGSSTGPVPPGEHNARGNVTPRQVYVAFRQAGIPAGPAVYLTAIAGVESGYSTNALNTNAGTGDYSVGLTQINYFGGLYAERAPHIGTPQQLLAGGLTDQAKATAWLYRQAGGLGPWQPDITSGKISQFMPGALAAAKGGP
jgi:hypothetical protein